ncbi:MAG: hypothetical protein IAF38_07480, partial [Bacteroidia bacterium]|nr:hypothetical protein [Bacteroidia bacterium]
RALIKTDNDSLKNVLEDKLELLRNEIRKELKEDSTKSLKSIKKMYRGFFTTSVADITVNFFDNLQKEYTNKFLAADREKDQLISGLLESDESEKKFLRIKDQYSNDYLSDVVKRKMDRNKTMVENGELKQLVDAVYLDPEESFFSFDTHFFAPRKYFFGKPVKTLYFNVLIIWLASIIAFIVLYFDLARKIISFFEQRGIKK